MTSLSIVSPIRCLQQIGQPLWRHWRGGPPGTPPPTFTYWAHHPDRLPAFVQRSDLALRYIHLLGVLDWDHFPERNLHCHWTRTPVPYAPFVAAVLVKLDQHLPHISSLRQFLVEHPVLTWVLGFPLERAHAAPTELEVDRSLPTQRHLTRMLGDLPNSVGQFLLDNSVHLIQAEVNPKGYRLGESVALDTKHIIAWVKENNLKAYVTDRFDKTQQPPGDPDCRLGCKRRHNQRASTEALPTPRANPVPAQTLAVGEFYWGYGSGIVTAKIPDCGEFVLAELTQPFDQPDASYFFPLMIATEKRLGFRPPYGTGDAAFDAFYVYDYFHQAVGFAAVPFSERGGYKPRQFAADGAPLCAAGLPMTLKYRFTDHSTLVEHERGRYVCPRQATTAEPKTCPIQDPHWSKGGCVTTMPLNIGARLRHTLDRQSETYLTLYKQRTATERINSQAVELGIERPKMRNGQAIANLNTLTYVLINLRALHRLRQQSSEPRD